MIPAGFRLGDGWEPRHFEDYSECTHGLTPLSGGCTTRCEWMDDFGAAACAEHGEVMGALVAVAPVVEAPPKCSDCDGSGAVGREDASCASCFGSGEETDKLTRLRAALATAEQRADRAEDKLRDADTLIAGLQERNRELFRERDVQLSSADDFGYRWIKAKEVLARIRAVVDEVGCDTYLARSIADILREGGA